MATQRLWSWYPVMVFCAYLWISGRTLAERMALGDDPELEAAFIRELINDVRGSDLDVGQFQKRFNPDSFGFSRGRRPNGAKDFGKRLNPASFSFNRGKRSLYSADDQPRQRYSPLFAIDEKRAPPSGFNGVRGKRGESRPEVDSRMKRRPPEGFVVARGRRAPPLGFQGLRGRKRVAPPAGFQGLRGRKRVAPPAGFQGLRGRKRAPTFDWRGSRWPARATLQDGSELGYTSKRSPPEGFLGLRGKRSIRSEAIHGFSVRSVPYENLDTIRRNRRSVATSGVGAGGEVENQHIARRASALTG